MRGAKFDPGPFLDAPVPSPAPLSYRARVRFHVCRGELGFKAFEAEQFVKVDDCLLARKELREALPALRKLVEQLGAGQDYEIELDFDPETQKVFAILAARKKIIYAFEDGRFVQTEVPHKTFLRLLSLQQTNPDQNANMVQIVSGLAGPLKAQTCLELFAGAGNFSFPLAGLVSRLVAVEFNRHAIELAHILEQKRKVSNIEFIAQAADSYLRYALKAQLCV